MEGVGMWYDAKANCCTVCGTMTSTKWSALRGVWLLPVGCVKHRTGSPSRYVLCLGTGQ